MVMEALRGYVQLASGLTEVTRERARSAARALVAQAGQLGDHPTDARTQVRALADDLATTARANRDLLIGMVRSETERAVASLGLVTADDLAALVARIDELERRVGRDTAGPSAGAAAPDDVRSTDVAAGAGETGAERATLKKAAAKKTAAKKTATKKAAVKKSASAPATAHTAPETATVRSSSAVTHGDPLADELLATERPAPESVDRKSSAKKVPSKKAPAKKTAAPDPAAAEPADDPADVSTATAGS